MKLIRISKYVESMPMVKIDELKEMGCEVNIRQVNGEIPSIFWDKLEKYDLNEDIDESEDLVVELFKGCGLKNYPTVEIMIIKERRYVVGIINICQVDRSVWQCFNSEADHGFGPTLYDIAIKYVSYRGGKLIPHETAKERYPWMPLSYGWNTPESANVWNKYLTRKDMKGDLKNGISTKNPQLEDPYKQYQDPEERYRDAEEEFRDK